MADIEQVREDLWKRIRTYQESGGSVRNEPMAIRFGGERGGFGCWEHTHPLCIIGLVQRIEGRALGISADDVEALEAGFEGWGPADLDLQPDDLLLLSPFYALGEEIAKKLEEEEAARAGA